MHALHLTRVLTLAAVIVSQSARADAAPRRVLLIGDPDDLSAATLLLEQAVREALEQEPETVVLDAGRESRNEAKAVREAEEGHKLRRSGREQFDSLELEAAARDLGKAVQKLDHANGGTVCVDALADTLSMLAAVQLLTGQETKARASIQWLVTLRPEHNPDPATYNPQMIEAFERVQVEVRSRASRELRVVTDPAGAAIYVDGVFAGTAPVILPPLLPGNHYLLARMKGREVAGRTIESAKSGDEIRLSLAKAAASPSEAKSHIAVRALVESSEIAPEAQALAIAENADEVVIVGAGPGTQIVARDATDGSATSIREERGAASDLDEARARAVVLLKRGDAPFASPKSSSPAPAVSSTSTDSTGPSADAAPASSGATTSATAVSTPAETATTSPGLVTEIRAAPATERPEVVAKPPSPLVERISPKRLALYGGCGATLLLAGTSGYFGYLALSANAKLGQAQRFSDGKTDFAHTTDQIEARALATKGKRNALIADVLGGVAIAAGIATLAAQMLWQTQAASHVSPAPGATTPAVSLGLGSMRVEF